MDLPRLRAQIDAIDGQILVLLNERLTLAADVGKAKAEAGAAVFAPDRENALMQRLLLSNPGSVPEEAIVAIWREILSASRAKQKAIAVGFLGDPGGLAHATAREFFGSAAQYHGFERLGSLLRAVRSGECECGVADTAPGEGFRIITSVASQLVPGRRFGVFMREGGANGGDEAGPGKQAPSKSAPEAAGAKSPGNGKPAQPTAAGPVPAAQRAEDETARAERSETRRIYLSTFLLLTIGFGIAMYFGGGDDGAARVAPDTRLTFRAEAAGLVVDPELCLLRPIGPALAALAADAAAERKRAPVEHDAALRALEQARGRVEVLDRAVADVKAQREKVRASIETNLTEKRTKLDAIWAGAQRRLEREDARRRRALETELRAKSDELGLDMQPVEDNRPDLIVSAFRMAVFAQPKPQQDTNLLVWADGLLAGVAQAEELQKDEEAAIRKQVETTRIELERAVEQDRVMAEALLAREQQAVEEAAKARIAAEQAEARLRTAREVLDTTVARHEERFLDLVSNAKVKVLLRVEEGMWQMTRMERQPNVTGDMLAYLQGSENGTNFVALVPVSVPIGSQVQTNATRADFRTLSEWLAPPKNP
jgi:chorismate mutase-like protein